MKMKYLKMLGVAASLAFPASLQAAPPVTDNTNPADSMKSSASSREKEVLTDIHQANQMEIDLGKMAQSRGGSEEVKALAKRIVDDHQQAQQKTQTLAQQQQFKLPTTTGAMDVDTQEAVKRLKTMRGADFDREYLRLMMAEHQKNITSLEAAETELVSTPVAGLLVEILPSLREHQRMAEDIWNRKGYANQNPT